MKEMDEPRRKHQHLQSLLETKEKSLFFFRSVEQKNERKKMLAFLETTAHTS